MRWIEVDFNARIRLEHVADSISDRTAFVTIMHAHKKTGTMRPIKDIVKLAQRHEAIVHSDAAQSVGKVAIDVDKISVEQTTGPEILEQTRHQVAACVAAEQAREARSPGSDAVAFPQAMEGHPR